LRRALLAKPARRNAEKRKVLLRLPDMSNPSLFPGVGTAWQIWRRVRQAGP
jgi:hypothetical protein